MTLPDVVYVVRPGEVNEELRYSLRSLVNLPHGTVWIAGHKPRWVTDEVRHIPVQAKPGSHVNAKANLRAACQHPEVAERFVYFNDDFFVMQALTELPVMHRGPLSAVIQSGNMATAYTRAMRKTLDILAARGVAEPLMYDLHAPMLVDKAGMLEALALCSYPMVQERTLYGNLQAIGGERRHNHKVRRSEKGWSSWPFLSTNDSTFASLPVGDHIRATFPDRSPYETDAPPRQSRRHPQRVAAPGVTRRPVRYTNDSVIRRISVAAR